MKNFPDDLKFEVGSRREIATAARTLAAELIHIRHVQITREWENKRLSDKEQLEEIILTIKRIRIFLEKLDKHSGNNEISRCLSSLAEAFLDFKNTNRTPSIFQGSPSNRPIDSTRKRSRKIQTVVCIQGYEELGLNSIETLERIKRIYDSNTKVCSPSLRTLRSWKTKVKSDPSWKKEFSAYDFNKIMPPPEYRSLTQLDSILKSVIERGI